MASIAVGIDFSTRSDRALRRAVLLAAAYSLELLLIHVIEEEAIEEEADGDSSGEWERRAALLEETSRTIATVDGVACRSDVRTGDVAEQLIGAASGVVQIVIGPHRRLVRDALTTVTAERIVRQSQVPVLIANAPPAGEYRRALVAIDPGHPSSLAAELVQSLPVARTAQWLLLQVYDAEAREMFGRALASPGEKQRYLDERADRARADLNASAALTGWDGARMLVREGHGPVADDLLAAATEERADLVVLAKSNKSGFERVVLGNVSRSLLRQSEVDALVVP